MAEDTGADGAVAMDCGNDVVGMAARAGGGAGDAIMVFDLMILVVVRIGGVASGAVRCQASVDGISDYCHFWADDCVMARGAGSWRIVSGSIMQGDNFSCRRECAVAVITLGAA